jgi:hypothetical protein
MTPSLKLEVKMRAKNILETGNNLREFTMKYSRLVVFIRHDSAEIWGFQYGLTLGIDTLKIMASTGVFARVVFSQTVHKHPNSSFQHTSSIL